MHFKRFWSAVLLKNNYYVECSCEIKVVKLLDLWLISERKLYRAKSLALIAERITRFSDVKSFRRYIAFRPEF